MKRRMLLSALGASTVGLAGCLGQGAVLSDTTATNTPMPTTHGGRREVRVTAVDTVPDATPLTPSVEVLRSSVNSDQTARIRVEVANTADQTVWTTTVRIPAFSKFVTEGGRDGRKLLLLQPDEEYATLRDGCWRADLSETQINWAYTDVVTETRYEPGGTRATQFDVYGHPENTGPCLPPGEYPIGATYAVSEDSDTETTEWEYRWGFSITVEES